MTNSVKELTPRQVRERAKWAADALLEVKAPIQPDTDTRRTQERRAAFDQRNYLRKVGGLPALKE